jgi:hypothetical protein
MNTIIHHLDKPHQPLQLPLDFHDNHHRQGCVAFTRIHSIHHRPRTYLFTWVRHIIHLLDLVRNDKWVATKQLMCVFDFNHTKLVFSSIMIGIKPITIEEHCFKIIIPDKVILDYIFNDPVVHRFVSLCINDPCNNSCIGCGRQRARSFKDG